MQNMSSTRELRPRAAKGSGITNPSTTVAVEPAARKKKVTAPKKNPATTTKRTGVGKGASVKKTAKKDVKKFSEKVKGAVTGKKKAVAPPAEDVEKVRCTFFLFFLPVSSLSPNLLVTAP